MRFNSRGGKLVELIKQMAVLQPQLRPATEESEVERRVGQLVQGWLV